MEEPELPTLSATRAPMIAGALAHLARHMETGCPRAAYLASILLSGIAADPKNDEHLRQHALQLVDILDAQREHGRKATDSIPRSVSGDAVRYAETVIGLPDFRLVSQPPGRFFRRGSQPMPLLETAP